MRRADELLARVLRQSLRPFSEMPAGERLLMEALAHGNLSKARRSAILDLLCNAQKPLPPEPTRLLEQFSTDDLINEIAIYRHDLSNFARATLKLIAKR